MNGEVVGLVIESSERERIENLILYFLLHICLVGESFRVWHHFTSYGRFYMIYTAISLLLAYTIKN